MCYDTSYFSLLQQLTREENESVFKSQQTENDDADISHLTQKVDNLSNSLSSLLQEEEAAEVQLSRDEHTDQATEQLLKSIKLNTQNARLEYELQKAEEQKQKAELEREATVVELKAKKDLSAQIIAQFCKLHYIEIKSFVIVKSA